MKNLKIVVNDNWVLITGKGFTFSYTPANTIVKEEYKDKYRYFGGLQCNYQEHSPEYMMLESLLADIAYAILERIEVYEDGSIA